MSRRAGLQVLVSRVMRALREESWCSPRIISVIAGSWPRHERQPPCVAPTGPNQVCFLGFSGFETIGVDVACRGLSGLLEPIRVIAERVTDSESLRCDRSHRIGAW